MDTHKNSVTVYIKRLPQFAAAARKELEEYFAEGQRGYGSYFAPGSARVATGLTPGEEDLLMPRILNIPKEDREFRKGVNAHFENIDIKVPGKEGLKLEIGLEQSNSEPVSADNLPLNVDHYLKYRHALGHPWIAPSEAEGKGNQLKQYYIYNPSEASKLSININEEKDTALSYYLTIKDQPRVVSMYLTLLGVRTDTLRRGEEVLKLREQIESKPKDFIAIYNDRDKEIKYAIEDMINQKILKRVGKNILIEGDGTSLGATLDEAILYLKDSRNSKTFAVLKARQQEKFKATTTSVETDEELEVAPVANLKDDIKPEEPEALEPAKEIIPAQIEPEVALAADAAADLDD